MTWIQTYTGVRFDPFKPRAVDVNVRDIAHALGNLCRFNGHCRRFYSVAQHSVAVSLVVPPADALAGLLHDAAEAYIADLVRPIKYAMPVYRSIERDVMVVVADKFNIPLDMPESVQHADRVLLATERRDLMRPDSADWECLFGIDPLEEIIDPWSPAIAKERFLERFAEILGYKERADG